MSFHPLTASIDERRIDAIFADLDQQEKPGAAIGIALDGRPVYRKGFGLANMELPLALTPGLRMRIYSVTKHFTCFAYLLLCEEGRAAIDDPIGRFFPDFHPAIQHVTMRQLMGNIGGIRDVHGLSFQFNGTGWNAPSDALLEFYRTTHSVDFSAGTSFRYNNGGFILLSRVIELLSGQTLGDFMAERIFAPVGMPDTLLRRTDLDFVPRSAAMHMLGSDGYFVKSYVGGDRSGTGGIVSTVDDMQRWMAHMDAPEVGSPETWALLKRPMTLANGMSTGYGCALVADSYRGLATLHHPGHGMGANAQLLKVPAAGLDVIVMVNREDVSSRELSLRILDACFPDLAGPAGAGKTEAGPPAIGTYVSPTTRRVIELAGTTDACTARISGYLDLGVAAGDDGWLEPTKDAVIPYKLRIASKAGAADAILLDDYGTLDTLWRVEPVAATAPPSGRFRSEEVDVRVVIERDHMHTAGRYGSVDYRLRAITEDIFHAEGSALTPFLSGYLVFDEGGFTFWSYCTRALRFDREAA